MELVNIQTFGFIVAFLFVAFAALVMAWSKRIPTENMRTSTKTKKDNIRCSTKKKTVPPKHKDHDQLLLRNRRSMPREKTQPPDRTTMQMAVTQLSISPSVDTPTSMPKATTQPRVIPIQQQPAQENMRRLTKRKKKNMRRSAKTMTVPANHEEHDQTSLRNRWSTPGTQPLDRTTTQTAVTRLPLSPTMKTPPLMPPTSTPKANTPLARPLTPTPSAPTSPVMATTTTPTAFTPLATPLTPTQRAPTPPARPSFSSPRSPTHPARAPTTPLSIPKQQQQPDMTQQLTMEQENMRRLTKRKKKNMRRSTKTMTVTANHEEHDQTSLSNRRSTPGTQPLDRTTTQTAVTRLPKSPTTETQLLMPPTSTPKATTPSPIAPTSPVMTTTTTPTAFTPLATSPTPTQGAPTPPAMSSNSAPRSPTHPARAPTPSLFIPLQQQQPIMPQQLTMEQENKMSKQIRRTGN